ncbi:MAG: hypothetical protein ACK4OL_05685 [Hyphomonas sp.]
MTDRPTPRDPKKSEMLEIRLDHETKTRLQTKASDAGLSVSAVVRSLIAAYLDPGERNVPKTRLEEFRHMTGRFIATRYRALAAALAASGLAALAFAPAATAEDITVALKGSVTRNADGTNNAQMFESTQIVALNEPQEMDINFDNGAGSVRFTYTVSATDQGTYLIDMLVTDAADSAAPTLANPKLEVGPGSDARIVVSGMGTTEFDITLTPTKAP